MFISHWLSDHFDFSYAIKLALKAGGTSIYSAGAFDLETWACETKDLPNFDVDDKLRTACALERGVRYMTLAVFMFASLLFGVVLLDWRSGKLLMVSWKNRRQSWELDYI